jgi:hypothetical protein
MHVREGDRVVYEFEEFILLHDPVANIWIVSDSGRIFDGWFMEVKSEHEGMLQIMAWLAEKGGGDGQSGIGFPEAN